MVNAKKKGNRGEHLFSEFLRGKGIKAYKDSASGGGAGEKGDIINDIGYCFEVKTVKALNVKKAWAQVDKSSGMNKTIPCLVIHFDGMPEGEFLMVQHSEDWIEMVTGNEKVDATYKNPQIERDRKYNLDALIRTAKNVLKDYE